MREGAGICPKCPKLDQCIELFDDRIEIFLTELHIDRCMAFIYASNELK